MLKIPILTYHSMRGEGSDYATNDHVALEEDLRTMTRLAFGVVPLRAIVRHLLGEVDLPPDLRVVGLTFDDAPHWDWHDYDFPGVPLVKSMRRILHEAAERATAARLPRPSAVSFAIASPQARAQLDARCIAGRGDWTDHWWREAAQGHVIAIGNHSWDHVHPALDRVEQAQQRKGSFAAIASHADADAQIRVAQDYIDRVTGGRSTRLFAYPYGDVPDYLADEYFPRCIREHRQLAAFTTGGEYATRGASRWRIPRFVCGSHWQSAGALEALLLASR